MVDKTYKKMDFVFSVEDFDDNSKVPLEYLINMIDSFKNYLIGLDNAEFKEEVPLTELKKLEKDVTNKCIAIIKGDMCYLNDKGEMTMIKTTKDMISKLLTEINHLVLTRNKIRELEK